MQALHLLGSIYTSRFISLPPTIGAIHHFYWI